MVYATVVRGQVVDSLAHVVSYEVMSLISSLERLSGETEDALTRLLLDGKLLFK